MKKTYSYFWQHGMIVLLCVSMITMTACSVDQVLSDIDVALQMSQQVEGAIGAVSPADAAILQGLTGLAVSGLQAIQKDYDTYEKSKNGNDLQKTLEAVKALQANLSQNFASAHVYSPTAQQKCQAWVNLVTTSLEAVSLAIAPQNTNAKVRAIRTIPTPESLQARWENEVCSGDTACGQRVKPRHRHAKGGFWSSLGNAAGEAKFGG